MLSPYKASYQKGFNEIPYTIPTITSNGTMGEDTFAVSSENSYANAYKFFTISGETSMSSCGSWFSWYYPQPAKLTYIEFDFDYSELPIGGITGYIQASNDNSTWTNLESFVEDDYMLDGIPITISNPDFYSYYRILITSSVPSSCDLYFMNITQYIKINSCAVNRKTVRHYYKYQYSTFTRPNLSSEGTLGGNAFAVSASGQYSSTYAIYKAVDGDNSTGWEVSSPSTAYYIFYNPIPLALDYIYMKNWTGSGNIDASKGGKVYGSNDNINWTELVTYTNSVYTSGGWWLIDMSSVTDAYNYYKITCTDGTSNNRNYWNVAEITPLGSERTVIESTSTDYDFYKDEYIYRVFNI